MKFIVLLAMLFVNIAKADVVVVNIGATTSPTAMYAQAYAKNLQVPNKVISVKNCQEAVNVITNEPHVVVVVANDIYLQNRRLGTDCTFAITPRTAIAMSDAYFEICKRPASTKTFKTPNVRVGRASVHPIREWELDFNYRNQTSVKGIGYSGSRAVLAAVLNGEVDWGYIATEIAEPAVQQGQIDCPYDTNSQSRRNLGNEFAMLNNEYVLKYMLIALSNDNQTLTQMRGAAQNVNFQNYVMASRHQNFTYTPTFKDIDKFMTSVRSLDALLETYK